MNAMNRRQLIKMAYRTVLMSVVPISIGNGYNDDNMHRTESLTIFDGNLDNQVDCLFELIQALFEHDDRWRNHLGSRRFSEEDIVYIEKCLIHSHTIEAIRPKCVDI